MALTDLGRFILIRILSEWLSLTDFVTYDSAVCSAFRSAHLDSISEFAGQFQAKWINSNLILPYRHEILLWFTERSLKLSDVIQFELDCSNLNPKPIDLKCLRVEVLRVKKNVLQKSQMLKSVFPSFVDIVELHCDNVSALKQILKYCRSLRKCHLTLNKQKEQIASLLLRTNSAIESLYINAVTMDATHPFRFSKWFIPSVVVHGGNVTSIGLNQCGPIKKRSIDLLALHCRRNLYEFSFSGFSDVSLRTFLWYKGPCLRTLNVSHCAALTDCIVDELVEISLHLEDLNVSYCSQLTDYSIAKLVGLERLHSLSLQGLTLLTDASLLSLQSSKDRLRLLSFRRNEGFTVTGLQSLSISCLSCSCLSLQELPAVVSLLPTIFPLLSQLTSLDLSFNRILTDAQLFVGFSVLNCPALKSLFLGACDLITDSTLSLVASKCWYLERLSMHSCYMITDGGVLSVVEECKRLRNLNVTYTAISDTAIDRIRRMNPRLRVERNRLD